jgi:hypothetical protein
LMCCRRSPVVKAGPVENGGMPATSTAAVLRSPAAVGRLLPVLCTGGLWTSMIHERPQI